MKTTRSKKLRVRKAGRPEAIEAIRVALRAIERALTQPQTKAPAPPASR